MPVIDFVLGCVFFEFSIVSHSLAMLKMAVECIVVVDLVVKSFVGYNLENISISLILSHIINMLNILKFLLH